ncbi:hypothetical protein AZE42_11064 [Rhizopogon vesiculosus]|uniref:Uncharacterized protein n=1 Tax=Rhizopogon vesiculosus TaxID=180088 RepID=A0A1J8QK94_9AGAM|nr:hypothetical protein AZE42_11064 [Rhizopogon vesiculosus]
METWDVFIPFENSTQSGIGWTRPRDKGTEELIATYSYPRLAELKLPPEEHQLLLTKDDNNHVDDIELYQGLNWLERRHIVGKDRGYIFFTLFLFVPYFFTISDLVPCPLLRVHVHLAIHVLPIYPQSKDHADYAT